MKIKSSEKEFPVYTSSCPLTLINPFMTEADII